MRIAKLRGADNWVSWKFQLSVTLKSNGTWDITKGNKPKPAALNDQAAQPAEIEARERDIAIWQNLDNNAQRIIATTVDEQPLLHIMNCESSKEMWDKLTSVYEQNSEANKHMLQQKWYSMSKDPADDMASHVAKLENLAHRLKTLGEQIPDSMIITKILMTLPFEYNHFMSAWESTHQDERNLTNLVARLNIEEMRMRMQNASLDKHSEGGALAASRDGPRRGENNQYQGRGQRRPGVCYICDKPGHWARECRSKKNIDARKEDDEARGDALVSETMVSVNDESTLQTAWYLDSGATDHMSNQRSWFVNFKRLSQARQVRIGNGKRIPATGEGDVNILAFDGEKWNEMHLKSVPYVPEFKYNLFSLRAALDNGVTLESSATECRLRKAGKIVAVGARENRLFEMRFRQNSSSNCVVVANVATRESLKTWHEKLAHQNVKQVRKTLKDHGIDF